MMRESSSLLGAVILAGGRATRLPGKCFRKLAGKELVCHVLEGIYQVTQEIVVATRDEEDARRLRYLLPAAKIVLDDSREESPLIGFLSGSRAIEAPYVLVAPCDTPFIQASVLRFLLQQSIGKDGVVTVTDREMIEPLCAVYRRQSAIDVAMRCIHLGCLSMLDMIDRMNNIARVPVKEIRKVDPQLLTFQNINTADDFAWAERTINEMSTTKT
jgi:molybdopterin-guanine dinucleotide biosynthesis protein A